MASGTLAQDTQQPWPHAFRTHGSLGHTHSGQTAALGHTHSGQTAALATQSAPSPTSYKGNIQCDACLPCLHPSNQSLHI